MAQSAFKRGSGTASAQAAPAQGPVILTGPKDYKLWFESLRTEAAARGVRATIIEAKEADFTKDLTENEALLKKAKEEVTGTAVKSAHATRGSTERETGEVGTVFQRLKYFADEVDRLTALRETAGALIRESVSSSIRARMLGELPKEKHFNPLSLIHISEPTRPY